MVVARKPERVAFGFSVHTGWAALTAMSGHPDSAVVVDRRRVEMIVGSDPGRPPYVYHAARELAPEAAEGFIRKFVEQSRGKARAALKVAVDGLRAREYEVVASGIVTGDRPVTASLDGILKSHALVHAAEGEMYRAAIRAASEALELAVVEVRAGELRARASKALGVSAAHLEARLAGIGRVAGSPWAKDQKDACLAALVALLA